MKNRTRLPRSPRRRRGGRPRLFVLGAACLAPLATVSPALAADADQGPVVAGTAARAGVMRFDIPAGPLETVLAAFERVTQVRAVLNDSGLRTLQSLGVSGNLTAEQAMQQLLAGLSVRATFEGSSVTLGVRGVNEFVEVAGTVSRTLQSPKYREGVRDTPQEIVVIPQEVFAEQNATSLRDVLRNTPGITMGIGEGNTGYSFGDSVNMRGFNVRNDIYIDGARDSGEISRDTFNVEAVEVAKGPTSVTGGRGSTGGSINLVTKSATLTDSASGRLTFGNAEHKRGTFDVNRRLSDTMAFRLNGMWQDAGYPGRDVQQNKQWGFAPTLGIGLGTPTQVTVSYSRLQQDNIPDLGIPTLLPDNAIAAGITVDNLDFHNYYGIASRDYEKTTSDIFTTTVQHRFNSMFTLRNLTRYGSNFRDAVDTPPRPVTAAAGQGSTDPGYNPNAFQMRRTDTKYQYRHDKVTTNQTDVSSAFRTGRVSHSADVGLEFAFDRQPAVGLTDLFTYGRPPVVDLFNPDPYVTYRPDIQKNGASTNAVANSTAVYAFDTVKFDSHWQADLGLRFDHVNVDYTNVATTGVATNFGRTDDATTGRAGLVYKPIEKGSIYGAFSTAFAPSYDGAHGLTQAATGGNSQALPPEKTRNVEAGTKWDLADSVQFSAAVFSMEKTNAKTTDLTGATVLLGDQKINGVEFDLSGAITERWSAFGGVSLMNGEVRASGILTEVGAQLPYVPKAMLNLWSTYQLPKKITLGGGVNYSNGHFFNQTGTFNFVAGGTTPQPKYAENAAAIQALTKYWLFNAMASYPVNRHLTLQVNLNNIGNEKYSDRAYDRHFLPGPTRQILFSPVFSF